MEISKKKAKEILDFLARRIKYDRFAIMNNKLVLCKDDGFHTLFFVDIENLIIDVARIKAKRKGIRMSYRNVLSCMLNTANAGYRVETYNDEVMLHAYETIEQILVEMDLEGHG